jgi:hypothetical protein
MESLDGYGMDAGVRSEEEDLLWECVGVISQVEGA